MFIEAGKMFLEGGMDVATPGSLPAFASEHVVLLGSQALFVHTLKIILVQVHCC